MKYKQIYHWDVEEEVKTGNRVYLLYPLSGWTACVNELSYQKVMQILAKDNVDDYFFWKNIEEEEE